MKKIVSLAVALSVFLSTFALSARAAVLQTSQTDAVINEINNARGGSSIESNLNEWLQILGFTDEYIYDADEGQFAKLIFNEAVEEPFTFENIEARFKQLAIISVYNTGNIDVYDYKTGAFLFRDELMLDEYYNGTPFMDFFDELISKNGKIEVQDSVSFKNFYHVDDFFTALSENIFLNALSNPAVAGHDHISEILVPEVAETLGFSLKSYSQLSTAKKNQVNMKLASYDYETVNVFLSRLEKTVKSVQATSNSSGGGGGGGGGYRPFEYTFTATNEIIASFEGVCYETDVDFILAAYDGDELIGLKKTELEAGKEHSFDVTLSLSRLTDDLTVKRFIWSADGNCTPLVRQIDGECIYKNTVIFPSSDFIEYIEPNVIKYESEQSAKPVYYKISENCIFFVNGKACSWDEYTLNEYLNYRNTDIRLEDISEDKDGLDNVYDKIYVNYYVDAVVDYVVQNDGLVKVYFKESTNGESKLAYDNDYTDVKFIKDGEEISVDELNEYDVLTIAYNVEQTYDDSSFYTIYVSDKIVSGTLDGYNSERNTICLDSVEYECSDIIYVGEFKLSGVYEVYLNRFGQVIYVEEISDGNNYGVIVGAYESNQFNYLVVRMITTDGEIKIIECKTMAVAEDVIDIISGATGEYRYGPTYLAKSDITEENIRDLVVEYKLSENKISKVSCLSCANSAPRLEYRESTSKFGSYAVNENTKFVCIEDYLNGGSEVSALTLDNFEDEIIYDIYMYGKNKNTGIYRFGLVLGGLSSVRTETPWAVVKSTSTCIYKDEECYKLEVLKKNKRTGAESETVYVSTAIEKQPKSGDVVMYSVGVHGYVEDRYFYTVTEGQESYADLFEDAMRCDYFSEMIDDVVRRYFLDDYDEIEYVFGPVYQKVNSGIEIIKSQLGGVSDLYETETYTIDGNVKSYICDYSKRDAYRFYCGDVPEANKQIYRPALEDDETISWSLLQEEKIQPNFALLKVIDGDVTEVVSFTANMTTVDKTETGVITAYDTDKNTITINGVEYVCDAAIDVSGIMLGVQYIIYFNADGYVSDFEEIEEIGTYGVIVSAYESNRYDYPVVQMVTDNGEVVLAECKNSAVAEDVKDIIFDATGEYRYGPIYLAKSDITEENIRDLVVEYKLNGETIAEVSTVASANSYGKLEYKENFSKFGSYDVNENTKFVCIEDYLNGGSEVFVLTFDNFEDEIIYDMYMYGKNKNTGTYNFGLVLGGLAGVRATTPWAVVKNASICIYENEECYELEVLKTNKKTGAESETVYVSTAIGEQPKSGDVVMYSVGVRGYVEAWCFYTVSEGQDTYDDLFGEVMSHDNFSEIINDKVMAYVVAHDDDAEYVFGAVYQKANSAIEIIKSQSDGVSDLYEVETYIIDSNTKSYICDYSKRGDERFYEGNVPNVSQNIFRPALGGWELEIIDWEMARVEKVCPNFALLKVIDGDVTEVVTFIAE